MDLTSIYRDKTPSLISKAILCAIHFAVVLSVFWILIGNGMAMIEQIFLLGHQMAPIVRIIFLVTAASLYFLRTFGTLFIFIKRRVPWSEVATIAIWVGAINLLFAYIGGSSESPVGLLDIVGCCLVAAGSMMNSGSEWQRYTWKKRSENKGHLFTGGLWKYSRHINYFGDFILFIGWGLLTGRFAPLVIPLLMICGFVFVNVPAQDRYLEEHYGDEYRSYANNTPRLIPYLY